MKILYKLTTRSRPEKMFACIENIRSMAIEENPWIIVSLDRNDPTLQRYLDLLYPMRDMNIYTYSGYSKNKIDAFNRDIPKEGWDLIVPTSDDIIFKKHFDIQLERDAAHAALELNREDFKPDPPPNHIGKKTLNNSDMDFTIWYGDGAVHSKIMTVPIMTMKYYKRLGYVYNPIYQSLFCDEEAIHVGENLKKIYYSTAEIFEHMHPAWGKAAWDPQYRATDSLYYVDKKTFEKRKAANFPV